MVRTCSIVFVQWLTLYSTNHPKRKRVVYKRKEAGILNYLPAEKWNWCRLGFRGTGQSHCIIFADMLLDFQTRLKIGWCYLPDGPVNNCDLAIHRTGRRIGPVQPASTNIYRQLTLTLTLHTRYHTYQPKHRLSRTQPNPAVLTERTAG